MKSGHNEVLLEGYVTLRVPLSNVVTFRIETAMKMIATELHERAAPPLRATLIFNKLRTFFIPKDLSAFNISG